MTNYSSLLVRSSLLLVFVGPARKEEFLYFYGIEKIKRIIIFHDTRIVDETQNSVPINKILLEDSHAHFCTNYL